MRPDIRPMSSDNIGAVAELERLCFASPWSLDSFCSELLNPIAVYRVAFAEGEAAGYAGMHRVLDEGHVTNVAVAPAHRRKGIARALVEDMCRYCRENALAFLTLETRSSNASAIALYEGLGFKAVGRRKNYYCNPPEDALLMTKTFSVKEEGPREDSRH